MVTNEERHIIAKRIRGIKAEYFDQKANSGWIDRSLIGITAFLGDVAKAAGLHFAPYEFSFQELRDALADLIEPDKDIKSKPIYSPNTLLPNTPDYKCSICNHFIYLKYNYCPFCGKELDKKSKEVNNANE